MFSRFFIERPIFATVLAVVTVLAGLVSVLALPIAQYPEISPPTVQVSTFYPGANANVVADTVAAPIEAEVIGVEDMMYMSSNSGSDGSYALTVTFELGTDLDMATVLVQNRVAIAMAKLPEEVSRQGVTTKKQSTNIILMITLSSEELGGLDLSNYAISNIKDELAQIKGVGDVKLFGAEEYSMRIWLDPEKLKARHLTTSDVLASIREQNVQVAAGQIGQPPAPDGQAFQYTINTLGRLVTTEQFENIIVKATGGGRVTRIKDIATVELGAKSYNIVANKRSFNQQRIEETGSATEATTCLAIYQLPGANALEVANNVRKKMDELRLDFETSGEIEAGKPIYKIIDMIPFDTTKFVEASIEEVYWTLLSAILLVFLTIYVFLQDWRATLIPAATIPVSLVGTFAVMVVLGFSINMLTLFGLVLAIGIVVDDAIVVVENVSRLIDEEGLSPKEATLKAMDEVTGPVIATTLVLLAVFLPTAFMGGITGEMYRQFALTIAAATVISSVNALTLSPALCAMVLRGTPEKVNPVFRLFNRFLDLFSTGYMSIATLLVRRALISMILFGGICVLTGKGFTALPTGFLPEEDQGYVMISVQLPDAASRERTEEVVEQIATALNETPGVEDFIAVAGYSLIDSSNMSNAAAIWVIMDPWEKRTSPELKQDALLATLRRKVGKIQDGMGFTFVPPAITGLGVGGGFEMKLRDKGVGLEMLQEYAQEMVRDGNQQSGLMGLNSTFRANVPQVFVDVDRDKAKSMDVSLESVNSTLQAYLGSAYVNDFTDNGRVYQVTLQAEQEFRNEPNDINSLYARNGSGEMAPMGAIVKIDDTLGPQIINRYQNYPAASVNGGPAIGQSSGQAMAIMEDMAAAKLPQGVDFQWTGMSFQEKQVGSEVYLIFGLAILLVFLVLAAQYESWSSPLAVILSVPLALLGTVIAVMLRGFDCNTYTQIGIVLLVALASKNAILIVEFAREARASGLGITDAALQSARLRFRPILMTALSFIFGTIPLVIASGAAAASRQALGTAVFGGMIAATVLGVLFVPAFYVVCQSLGEGLRPLKTKDDEDSQPKPKKHSSLETTLDMPVPPPQKDPTLETTLDMPALSPDPPDDDEWIDLPGEES